MGRSTGIIRLKHAQKNFGSRDLRLIVSNESAIRIMRNGSLCVCATGILENMKDFMRLYIQQKLLDKEMILKRPFIVAPSADISCRKRRQKFQDGTRKAAYATYTALDATK